MSLLFSNLQQRQQQQRQASSSARNLEEEGQEDDDEAEDHYNLQMNTLHHQSATNPGEVAPLLSQTSQRDDLLRQPSQIVRIGKLSDDKQQEQFDPLLEVVDRIEDDLDQPYEDLVPLEVKLALEEKVFGWSHLSSDILGHIVFTAGAYCLVYIICTNLLEKHLSEWLFRGLRVLLASWAGLSAFRMVRRRRRVWLRSSYGSKDYERDASRRRASIRDSDRNTILGRIRRRRAAMVERGHQRKLRRAAERFTSRHQRHRDQLMLKQQEASFGPPSPVSVCHLSDSDKEEETADSTESQQDGLPSLPVQGNTTHVHAKVAFDPQVIQKQPTLQRRRRKRSRSFHAFSMEETKSIGHDEILFSSGPVWKVPYAHGGFFGAAPFMLANPHWIDVLRLLMPDVYIEISRRVLNAPAPRLIHWAENNPVVAAYGTAHELENNGRVPNIEWDVFLDPHHVHLVKVVLDEQEKFLRSCVPIEMRDVPGNQLRKQVLGSIETIGLSASQHSILQYYEKELQDRTALLVDKILIAHGNLTQLILEQTGCAKKYNFSRVKRTRRTLGGGIYARQWFAIFAEALKLGTCLDHDHGNEKSSDDIQDAFSCPFLPSSPTSSTDESDDLSGAPRCDCLQCAACILSRSESCDVHMGNSGRDQDQQDSVFRRRPELRRSNTEGSPLRGRTSSADMVSSTSALTTSISESIALLKSITRCDSPVGLVFDVKSRHVPHQVWGLVVDSLRAAGARVEGVASFTVEEIRDISRFTSVPVKEILFFHSAGDMQYACHTGSVKHGDTVLFNAGSLLWQSDGLAHPAFTLLDGIYQLFTTFDVEGVKSDYQLLPFSSVINQDTSQDKTPRSISNTGSSSTIQQYKDRFNLNIGLYCQEFSIDEAAVNKLVQYVNDNHRVYNLGLSWGGVNGLTLRSIQPGRFTSTDGFWNQRYAGVPWDPTLSPRDIAIETIMN